MKRAVLIKKPPPFGEGDYYTTSEFAEVTGYSQDTISEYARKGKIVPPAQKRAGDWWIQAGSKIIRYRHSPEEGDYDVEYILTPERRIGRPRVRGVRGTVDPGTSWEDYA